MPPAPCITPCFGNCPEKSINVLNHCCTAWESRKMTCRNINPETSWFVSQAGETWGFKDSEKYWQGIVKILQKKWLLNEWASYQPSSHLCVPETQIYFLSLLLIGLHNLIHTWETKDIMERVLIWPLFSVKTMVYQEQGKMKYLKQWACLDVPLLQHTRSKWSARHRDLLKPENDSFFWIMCVWAGNS